MKMLPIARTVALAWLVGVSACTADRTTSQSTVAEWTIDSVPLLEIGTRDGPGETQFAAVYGVRRLRDSSIVVVDGATPAVRVFNARGAYVRTIGRRGDGPGEYRKPRWIAESDSGGLFVYDAFAEAVGRLIHYDRSGAVLWSETLHALPDATPSTPSRLLRDETLLLTGPVRDTYRNRPDGLPVQGMDGVVVWRRGEPARTLRRVPGQIVTRKNLAWSDGGMVAFSDSLIYSANAYRYAIAVHALDGSQRDSIVRADYPVVRTTRERIDLMMAEARAYLDTVADPAKRQALETQFAAMTFPDTFPLIARMLTDEVGQLWVQLVEQRSWSVYAPDGTHIADMPPLYARFTIRQIEADQVIGVWRDADDVPLVRIHRLRKR